MTSKEQWPDYELDLESYGDSTDHSRFEQSAPNSFQQLGVPTLNNTRNDILPHAWAGGCVSVNSGAYGMKPRVQHASQLPPTSLPQTVPNSFAITPPSHVDSSLLEAAGDAPLRETGTSFDVYGLDPEDEAALEQYLRERSRSPFGRAEHECDPNELQSTSTGPLPSWGPTDGASRLQDRRQSIDTSVTQHGQSIFPDDDRMDGDKTTTNTIKLPPSLALQSNVVSTTEQKPHTGGRKKRPPKGYVSKYEFKELVKSSGGHTSIVPDARLTRRQRVLLGEGNK